MVDNSELIGHFNRNTGLLGSFHFDYGYYSYRRLPVSSFMNKRSPFMNNCPITYANHIHHT